MGFKYLKRDEKRIKKEQEKLDEKYAELLNQAELERLEKRHDELERKGELLFSGLESGAKAAGLDVTVNHIGSMGTMFFNHRPVTDFDSAKASDEKLFRKYYSRMIEMGIYLAPSPFEASFISVEHTDEILIKTLECARKAFEDL